MKAGLVVMLKALAVLSRDLIQRLLQLRYIFCGASIQGFLHHRLFGAGRAPKGPLQAWVSSQARIDFHQPVGSCQQADPGIIELVSRRMLDGFLPNLYLGTDRAKQIELTQLHSYGCQAGSRAKMVRRACDRLVHGDAPPNESFFGSSLAMEHHPAFRKLFKGWRTCRYFGRNLGMLNTAASSIGSSSGFEKAGA